MVSHSAVIIAQKNHFVYIYFLFFVVNFDFFRDFYTKKRVFSKLLPLFPYTFCVRSRVLVCSCARVLVFLQSRTALSQKVPEQPSRAARTILEQNAGLILVFMSANPSYFRDVYKVRHTYFLTKPIDAYYFDDCMRRIRAQLSMRRLVLDIGGENRVIELQNVLYLESALRKTIFHFRGGSTLSVNRKMQEVEEAIPSPAFARVHKSFIVNLDNVAGIECSCVMFDDKTKVNISRPFIKSFREKTALYFNQVL